jgi:hypothetical protein
MGPTARRRHCHAVACTNPYCPPRVHGKEDKVDFGNNTRLYSAGCTRWAGRGHPPGRDIWRRCNLGQQLSRAACVEPSCWHCAVGAFLRLGCFWLDTRRAKGHSGSWPSHLVWLPAIIPRLHHLPIWTPGNLPRSLVCSLMSYGGGLLASWEQVHRLNTMAPWAGDALPTRPYKVVLQSSGLWSSSTIKPNHHRLKEFP